MKLRSLRVMLASVCILGVVSIAAGQGKPRFRMLVLAEHDKNHYRYVEVATHWLDSLAQKDGFNVHYISNPDSITTAYLSDYDVVFQMNFPPYMWNDTAKAAFVDYLSTGRGGWVGVHHASLLGEFDGYPMWNWFSDFLGGIRFTNYIAGFAAADVNVEDKKHPVMKGVPATFNVTKDEWYTYDRSPRPNVHVLASVDESTYAPDTKIKMGDHPVVWTNDKIKGRNIYIFMGHDPSLFRNPAYVTLLRNSLRWASGKK